MFLLPVTIMVIGTNRYPKLSAYGSRLITPPSEEEEVYPYRRVWPSIVIQTALLFVITMILFVGSRFFSFPEELFLPINLILALMPFALWVVLSWWRERFVLQPRNHLMAVAIVTGLAANAVGIPLINGIFQVNQWLPLESAINRIVGYTFTTGLIQTLIIYLIIRYMVWSNEFRIRLDAVAYGTASAVGYVTVTNLQLVLTRTSEPTFAAMNVFNQFAILTCISIVISFGLSETRFNTQPFPLLMVATVALASFISGLAIPLIAGFANAALSPLSPVSTTSPIQGFIFSTGLLGAVGLAFWLLFNTAERQEEESPAETDESIGL